MVIILKIIDVTGQRFGKLVVLKENRSKRIKSALWLCQCDCGNYKEVTLQHLKKGTKSCGCLSKEVAVERGRKSMIGERSKKNMECMEQNYIIYGQE